MEDDRLQRFAYQLDDSLRNAPHTLGDEAEATLSYFSQSFGTPNGIYSMMANSDIPWPEVEFSTGGSLILSARQSLGPHAGWRAMAWAYDGSALSEPIVLWPAQGRWRPIALAGNDAQMIAACQRDNLPL